MLRTAPRSDWRLVDRQSTIDDHGRFHRHRAIRNDARQRDCVTADHCDAWRNFDKRRAAAGKRGRESISRRDRSIARCWAFMQSRDVRSSMSIADVSRAAHVDTHADTHVDRRSAPRIASPSRSRNMRRAGAFDIDERPNAVTNDASMHGTIAFARHPIRMRCAQSRMA
ncbi:hypothetical protein [Burkholderia thailandensis]|uniref:hypothetical protein n=1 Tax=Burkholderia thailandensis TaxID=57975 RepID=UPI0012DA024C|nr:hypothetical protein [Burkholderia thailandensis]